MIKIGFSCFWHGKFFSTFFKTQIFFCLDKFSTQCYFCIWRAQELKSTNIVKNQWVTMDFPQQYTDFESVFKKNIFQAVKIRLKKSDNGF